MPHHINAQTYQKIWIIYAVDSAGFDGRTSALPREVSATTSWLCRELSRGHSRKSCCNDTTVAVWMVSKLIRSDARAHRGGVPNVLVGLIPHQKQQPKDWTLNVRHLIIQPKATVIRINVRTAKQIWLHQTILPGLENRRIRDPYVRWCESLSDSLWLSAGYSISNTILFF